MSRERSNWPWDQVCAVIIDFVWMCKCCNVDEQSMITPLPPQHVLPLARYTDDIVSPCLPLPLLTSHRSPNNSWSPAAGRQSQLLFCQAIYLKNLVPWSIWPLSGNYSKLCKKFSDLNIWCLILKWKGVSFNPYILSMLVTHSTSDIPLYFCCIFFLDTLYN